jgi:hypothetical protein
VGFYMELFGWEAEDVMPADSRQEVPVEKGSRRKEYTRSSGHLRPFLMTFTSRSLVNIPWNRCGTYSESLFGFCLWGRSCARRK